MKRTKVPDDAPQIPGWDADYYAKAEHRAAGMTEADIYGWIENGFSGMYKAMSDYRKDGQPESLEEMQEGLTATYALLAELKSRRETRLGR